VTATPVIKAASGGLTRHLVQTLVIIIVLAAATAAALLGVALLANGNEAFSNGFATHHGADISVTVDTSHVTRAQLAATRHVAGVTEIAGPYPELTITYRPTAPWRARWRRRQAGQRPRSQAGRRAARPGWRLGRRRRLAVHRDGPGFTGRAAG
jgi:hypothetical protein